MKNHDYGKRIAWACRRGMLELDIILRNFLAESYPKLSAQQQLQFGKLLEATDPELYSWLLGYSQPDNENLREIIHIIREFHAALKS